MSVTNRVKWLFLIIFISGVMLGVIGTRLSFCWFWSAPCNSVEIGTVLNAKPYDLIESKLKRTDIDQIEIYVLFVGRQASGYELRVKIDDASEIKKWKKIILHKSEPYSHHWNDAAFVPLQATYVVVLRSRNSWILRLRIFDDPYNCGFIVESPSPRYGEIMVSNSELVSLVKKYVLKTSSVKIPDVRVNENEKSK
ncbi:MAG: hypothetical protein K8S55_09065 [Phycisphaerae bacterium]|nr:hypothetical protein [Phycisphaerae bacterium]